MRKLTNKYLYITIFNSHVNLYHPLPLFTGRDCPSDLGVRSKGTGDVDDALEDVPWLFGFYRNTIGKWWFNWILIDFIVI